MSNYKSDDFKVYMKDDSRLALIKKVQEKEREGYEPACKITKQVNTRYDNGMYWYVVMRKVV